MAAVYHGADWIIDALFERANIDFIALDEDGQSIIHNLCRASLASRLKFVLSQNLPELDVNQHAASDSNPLARKGDGCLGDVARIWGRCKNLGLLAAYGQNILRPPLSHALLNRHINSSSLFYIRREG